MNLQKINLLILANILAICSFSQDYVVKISNNISGENKIVYNLPKTIIVVEVEVSQLSEIRGPFYKYAEKYLGIKNVISSNASKNKITGIKFYTYPVADTDQYYAVNFNPKSNIYKVNLTEKGFLAGINLQDFNAESLDYEKSNTYLSQDINNSLSYANYSIKSSLEIRYDTLYKDVFKDSTFVRVPTINKHSVNKKVETQAKELVDEILLLRDDRNALLKGENDGGNIPDGNALKFMIAELNRLERDYMNLFTGKTELNKRYYKFEYSPNFAETLTDEILFKFSGNTGIEPKNSSKGQSVKIKLSPKKYTKPLKSGNAGSIDDSKKKGIPNGIFYRIPDYVSAEIFLGNSKIAEKNIKLAQYGTVNVLPFEIFTGDTKVEFYPKTGALKSIKH